MPAETVVNKTPRQQTPTFEQMIRAQASSEAIYRLTGEDLRPGEGAERLLEEAGVALDNDAMFDLALDRIKRVGLAEGETLTWQLTKESLGGGYKRRKKQSLK